MLKSYLSKLCSLALLLGLSFGTFAQNVTITAPASIAGDYLSKHAAFGAWLNGQSAELVLADDGTGVSNGCTITNDMTGKIALIDRGVCGFAVKTINAQAAGAIAVIICNNATLPDSSILMGSAAGDFSICGLTIPAVSLSYNNCNIIKAELVNGVTASFPVNQPAPGENFEVEFSLPGAGTYTAPPITGTSDLFVDATAVQMYTIVAPMTSVMNVNSCFGGADTRVTVFQGCRNIHPLIGQNDDFCEFAAGSDLYASNLDVIVQAGEEYLIVWDNTWDASGFDFSVSFGPLPNVDVTFSVDMQDQTVAPDGVKISINGGAEADMTDGGNGIWTYTTTVTAGDVLDYVFLNGAGNAEDDPDVAACRSITVDLLPAATPLVCYNSCTICPPDAVCPNWIDEDFEAYTIGGISDQSDIWNPWTPGSPTEDALVSNVLALSGTQSLLVSAANADDQLLLLGNRTSGNFVLKWKMYIPTGSAGYYNIQKDQNAPGGGTGTGLQVDFFTDGTGNIDAGAENNFTFTYPHDTWFEVYHFIDLDNDWMRLWVDGVAVNEWPASWSAFTQTGIKQLGAIDFYGNTDNLYYVDDVLLKEIEACPADAIICDAFDGYDSGELGGQSPWWGTWTVGSPTEDGLVNSEQFLSCEQSLKISEAGADDQLLLLGTRTSGNYWLSWDMYVPVGGSGYYNIQKKVTAATANADFAYAAHFAADGVCTIDVGAASAAAFPYPQGEWFNVAHRYDIDNDYATLYINGQEIGSWLSNLTATEGAGANTIGSVDFFGDAGNLYYVDNVLFVQLPSVPGNVCSTANDLNPYLGQGQGTVTSTPLFDNTNYSTTFLDPTTGYECFGEPDGTGSAPSLENTIWYTFTGDGQTYLIETGQCGSTNYIDAGDTQMAIYAGTCGNLVQVACNEDGPSATTTEYPAGLELATVAGTVYYMMIDGFNFQGALSDGEFCITFEQLTGTPVVDVTFRVNMELETVSAGGVRIAGTFTNWADLTMTDLGNDIWEVTVPDMLAGTIIQWKFKNGPNGWENNPALIDCGLDDGSGNINRSHTVGDVNETLGTSCFNWCPNCDALDANETSFAKALGMNPNPAGDYVNLTYNFGEMTNLNVRLVNGLGQVILERNLDNALKGSERLDIASLPGGAYSVVFSNGQQVVAKRLIIE